MNRNAFAFFTVMLALTISAALIVPAQAQFTLVKISTDKFTNSDSVHRTEVEPDFFSWGNTIVGTFHVARRARINRMGQRRRGLVHLNRWRQNLDIRHSARTDRQVQKRSVWMGSRSLGCL